MKSSRFKFKYAANASRLHRKIGEVLRNSPLFCNYEIYQEYPTSLINPSINNNKLRYDWVIPKLKIVIEGHGRQHEEVTSFGGGKTVEETVEDFHLSKKRDRIKEDAAIEAGYTFIEINYKDEDKITDTYIWKLYEKNKNVETIKCLSVPKNNRAEEYIEQERIKRNEYLRKQRKQQYEYAKRRKRK